MVSMKKPEPRRIKREKHTITHMVHIYCQGQHGTAAGALCPQCSEFLAYAHRRLSMCRYQASKPTCGKCPVHCYKPALRQQAIEIMKYAGPRMSYRHPVLALLHFFDGFKPVPPRR